MRKTIDKAKHLAHEVRLHGSAGNSGRDPVKDAGEEEETAAKIKLRAGHKGPYEFDTVKQLQVGSNKKLVFWLVLTSNFLYRNYSMHTMVRSGASAFRRAAAYWPRLVKTGC